MKPVTIITHTRGDQSPAYVRACQSVAAALPANGRHVTIVTPNYHDWLHSRGTSVLNQQGYVGFVDDDDTIEPDAIRLCVQALEQSGAGVAFTREVQVNSDRMVNSPVAKRYENILTSPCAVHHFVLLDASKIPTDILDAAAITQVGIDWYIKAATALTAGAIHVPYTGYNWYVDIPKGMDSDRGNYVKQASAICSQIQSRWYGNYKGSIPVFMSPFQREA